MTDTPAKVTPIRKGQAASPEFPRTTADDAWSTENGSYEVEKYYTGSTDGKGNHATVQVAVPPALAVEIDRLIQSGAIPEYQTRQDFFRDAIIHRAHWIAQVTGNPSFQKRVSIAMKIATLAQQERDKTEMEALIDGIERIIKVCVESNDRTTLAEVYETWEPEVERMPPSQRAKGKRILAVHRHLIDGGEGQ